jgi:membrane protease YdiL (CAAX protease family)
MTDRTKKIAFFLAFTFGVDWLMALVFFLCGGKSSAIGYAVMVAVYMYIPAIVAVLVRKIFNKDRWLDALGLRLRFSPWFFVAWLLPPSFALAIFGLSLLFPGVGFSPDASGFLSQYKDLLSPDAYALAQKQMTSLPLPLFWLSLLNGFAGGMSVNVVFAYGEELGWRGFLFDELKPLGFWRTSIVTGAIWGVWHAPLILMGHNYAHYPVPGVFMMVAWCLLLAPIFTFIRMKSKSVLGTAILHGMLNGMAALPIVLVSGGNELLTGFTGLAGFIVFALVDAAIFVYLKLRPPAEFTAAGPARMVS